MNMSPDKARSIYPELGLLIGREFRNRADRKTGQVFDPASAIAIGKYVCATSQDVRDALRLAVNGFNEWRGVSSYDRAEILMRIANKIRDEKSYLATLVTLELGKPSTEAYLEIEYAAGMFEWCAEEAKRAYGRVIPERDPQTMQFAIREPIGPIAAFVSWNAPLTTPSRKFSHALAAGCSVVMKASEQTPACALALGQIAYECGLPDGVLSILFGNPVMISDMLLESDVIRGLTFTGSTDVGKILAQKAAKSMKRSVMELGGHAPALIFDDVDLDMTIRGAIAAKYRNSGQICVSPTRFMVHRKVYDEFVEKFAKGVSTLVLGNGFDPKVTMGPLASLERLTVQKEIVADAKLRGLRIVTGGNILEHDGWFFEPTVIADATPEAMVSRVEPFGPIAAISPFDHIDEAIAIANSLPYGLAAYVMSNNIKITSHCVSKLQAGVVVVNGWRATSAEAPFGGHKESGLATEGGIEGIRAFQNIKTVRQF